MSQISAYDTLFKFVSIVDIVFSLQGNRITQGISCADVADVCIKSLHALSARNKTFEVCYEYTPESGLEMYELVAHLPAKSNNYLAPALSNLQKNT